MAAKKERFAAAEKRRKAMRKYLLMAGAALIGLGGSALAAIDCAVPPTCSELGYVMTKADCSGETMLHCPFDTNAVYCNSSIYKCKQAGYSSTKSCGTGYEETPCPYNDSYHKCTFSAEARECIDDGYIDCKALLRCTGNTVKMICGVTTIKKQYCKCTERPTVADPTPSEKKCAKINAEYFTAAACPPDDCKYGMKSTGVTGSDGACYRCGTKEECTNSLGAILCMACSSTSGPVTAH